jgi:hypothetical protein
MRRGLLEIGTGTPEDMRAWHMWLVTKTCQRLALSARILHVTVMHFVWKTFSSVPSASPSDVLLAGIKWPSLYADRARTHGEYVQLIPTLHATAIRRFGARHDVREHVPTAASSSSSINPQH